MFYLHPLSPNSTFAVLLILSALILGSHALQTSAAPSPIGPPLRIGWPDDLEDSSAIQQPLFSQLYQEQGINIVWIKQPLKRLIHNLFSGNIDGVILAAIEPEELPGHIIPVPITYSAKKCRVFLQTSINCNDLTDLSDLRELRITGYNFCSASSLSPKEIQTVNNLSKLFQFMRADRADFIWLSEHAEHFLPPDEPISICKTIPPTAAKMGGYINRKHAYLLPKLTHIYDSAIVMQQSSPDTTKNPDSPISSLPPP
jgi:hypothetical protein